MAGRDAASRELLLGALALESGAIDHNQLVWAVDAWSRSSTKPLSELLVDHARLDRGTLERLEQRVEEALSASGSRDLETDLTVAYPGPIGDIAGAARQEEDRIASPAGSRRYRVLQRHARGGLGEVFVAFDSELNRSVALKALQSDRAHDPASQARFLLEAEITGSLEHPGIVPVYSLSRHPDGRPYYAMRLIEGGTLRDAIARFHQSDSAPTGSETRELAFQRLLRCVIETCFAVAYAHSRNVVHRDLKPENIMLGRFGETLVVDWGLAKRHAEPGGTGAESETPSIEPVLSDASMTQPGSVIGTPRYMSPEQAAGDPDRVGPASDVYSLGAILYCVLVGHDAFPDGDVPSVLARVRRGIFPAPRRLRKAIDPALEAICLKAMSLDPAQRHTSALELANELEAWLADVRYRGEQEQALNQMKASLARLCLERVDRSFARAAHDEGMLWLARALESAPAEPPALARLIRASLSAWHMGSKALERRLRHGGEVQDLAFDPEGRRLATACADRSARLWDLATGSNLAPPMEHPAPVRAVAFQPDGSLIATGCDDGCISLWDALTGTPVRPPIESGAPITLLKFSPRGTLFAVAGGPGLPLLWDAATGRPLHAQGGGTGDALTVAFSPDGATLAAAHEDGIVRLWDAATGERVGDPLAHESRVAWLAFDPSGRALLTACLDGSVRLWDLARREPAVTLSEHARIRGLAFRPDGEAFVTADDDGTARLWESASGRPIGERLEHGARISCLAFRPDGTMLATGGDDGMLRFWCASTGLPIGPPQPHGAAIRGLGFRPDGTRIATRGTDGWVRVWKVADPVEGTAERVFSWVRIATNLDFDAGDAIRRIDGPTAWDLRRRLDELGGSPFR
jgi:WD40 repeat protein/serine/threonine protein kinase